MTQKYDRFKAAPWFQQGARPPVMIGGAGGIGSWLTLLLNRAGFETFVYDFDRLEAINMAGQLFMHKSIGKSKVDALAEVVKELCQDDIIPNYEKIDETTMTNDIIFSAFDNMKARKDMYSTWITNFEGNPKAIFIDGRLTAEQLTIFVIKGNDQDAISEYEKEHLFDDSEVEDLPCTFKQTSHGAAMIAAHMVEMFTNWYSGVLGNDTSRNADFFWEYFIPLSFNYSRKAKGWGQATVESRPATQEEIDLIDQFIADKGIPHPADSPSFPIGISIPEDYVRLDSGEIVPINDPRIFQSSSITVTHNMSLQEIKEKFGDTLTDEQIQSIYNPIQSDLTTEEIRELEDLMDESAELSEQDRREVESLISEGISTISNPPDSLDFEDENTSGSTSDIPNRDDDLPF